eukprot:1154808-Pelagomonas_calceolata.AAC.1
MAHPPQVQTERGMAGREERQVQQQERAKDDSREAGVPDLQQEDSSTVSLPTKESHAQQLTAEHNSLSQRVLFLD